MKSALTLVALCLAAIQPPQASAAEWWPDISEVASVDAEVLRLQVPREFGPLSDYGRYYWGSLSHGRRIINGTLLSPRVLKALGRGPEAGKAQIVPDSSAPGIADGGCLQVSVRYDADSGEMLDESCNFELPRPPEPSG